jgi:hypothetical protein
MIGKSNKWNITKNISETPIPVILFFGAGIGAFFGLVAYVKNWL